MTAPDARAVEGEPRVALAGPVRVKAHPGLCQGWGECHRWAPDVYALDADGKVDLHVAEIDAEHALDAWMGAEACPARAISVIGPPNDLWWALLRQRHADRRRARRG